MTGLSSERQVRCGDEMLTYRERGEGEPLVLLHAGVFSDWFLPVATAAELEGFRVIVPRRAGYVDGHPPSRHLDIADHARHCAELLGALGVSRVHLCGHSSSALMGLQLALDRPELVQSLVLLEPAPGGCLNGPTHAEVSGPAIGAAMAAYGAGDIAAGFDRFLSAVGGSHYRDVLERALGRVGLDRAMHQSAFFPDEARAVWEWRFEPSDAARIRTPMLLVQGARTAAVSLVPPESVTLLAAAAPHAEVVELADVSHLMPLEDPTGVARLIADFAGRQAIG